MLTRLRLCLSWLCPGRWCRRCSRTPPGGAHSLETCRSISLFFHTVCLSIRISWKCNFPRIQHVRQSVSMSVSQPSRHDECGPTFPPWWVWYYLPAMMSVVLPPRHDECGPTSPPWWVRWCRRLTSRGRRMSWTRGRSSALWRSTHPSGLKKYGSAIYFTFLCLNPKGQCIFFMVLTILRFT